MRKILLITLIVELFLFSCSSDESTDFEESTDSQTEWTCGTYNGKTLWTGPKGGCYYKNSNGNKTYVDRSECNNC